MNGSETYPRSIFNASEGFGRTKPHQASYRVAAVQMASGPHTASNLLEAARLIKMASEQGASVVALPEFFSLMGLKDYDKVKQAEMYGQGPVQEFLSRTARSLGVWIVGGSIPLKSNDPNRCRNACLVFDDSGECVARYDKMHLFGFQDDEETYQEANSIEPGQQSVEVATPFGRFGLAICYDLRFPELFRSWSGVDVIFVPSAFTATTGQAHWEVLLRARAIENLAYVVAPAQGGYHMNGRETHGHSMIINPWGVIMDSLPRGSGVVLADINPMMQKQWRMSLPALTHKRSELFPVSPKVD